jgi:hypothetical protein
VWGKIVVAKRTFRDLKIFPDGFREWDWRETGTRHDPGIQPADAEELVAAGATHVILSRGMDLVLQVPDATVKWLADKGIVVEVLESRLAVARYNELAASERVGALVHSTC